MNKKTKLKAFKISKNKISSFQSLVKNNWPRKNHVFSKNKNINFYYNFKNNKKTNLIGLYTKKISLCNWTYSI